MGNYANISVNSATVNGVEDSVTGSGTANIDEWSLDSTVDVGLYSGPVTIVVDFEEAHGGSGGDSTPYAILNEGNLSTAFGANYSLSVNPTTGVYTLTFDPEDYLNPGGSGTFTANFHVSGHGDADDTVNITFICFTEGTLLKTPFGERKVEDIRPGDMIVTKTNGAQAVRWVGSRMLDKIDLAANPHLKPVCIKSDAFGKGKPASNLSVSPQHRCYIDSLELQLMFCTPDALVPAKGLLDGTSVTISDQETVSYYHILFDQHEIVCSNGLWTESLYPGGEALDGLSDAAQTELLEIFPNLREDNIHKVPAAPLLTVSETLALSRYKSLNGQTH